MSMPFRSLLLAGFSLLSLFLISPTQAATLSAGDLLKIDAFPDVYYYGADAKRYVFPNEKTYFSWYPGFNTKTLSATELASISIGGAVTYKPGSTLVKLTTDPKVYAVAKGGVLRWIQTEALAIQLYGADWANKVHDLPDTFFTIYTIGAPISSSADYSPQNELIAAISISSDKNVSVPPTSTTTSPIPPAGTTSTSSLTLTVSHPTVYGGDFERLTAAATHPAGIIQIDLMFDGLLIMRCTSSPCTCETQVSLGNIKTNYEAKAIATAVDGTTLTQTFNVPLTTGTSSLVNLSVDRPTIRTNQLGQAILNTDMSIDILRTEIYLNGVSVKECTDDVRQCPWTDYLSGPVGTSYDIYGKVTDTLGRFYETAHKTITISTNDTPVATVLTGKTLIYAGENLNITVTGSDDDGILMIEIMKDGAVLKACQHAAPCTLTTGPWNTSGMLSFTGRVTDTLGLTSESEPLNITVQ